MRKKYPFVKQDDLKDCGVASLLMIIRYYQGNIAKEKLREMMKTSNSGTTAYDLIEASRIIGFHAEGIRCKIESLESKKIIYPCIAHVTIDQIYHHYVVIYQIDFKKKQLLIADPAKRLEKISFEQFGSIYNDILITMYPKKKIPIDYQEKSFWKFIKELLFNNKKPLFIVVMLSLLITILSVVHSFYFQISMQYIEKKKSLYQLLVLFLLLEGFKNFFLWIRNKIFIFINQKISKKLLMDTFRKIILLPYHYYRNRTSGELITRINDLNIINQIISEIILTFFIDLILTIVSAFILYSINSLLFIFSLTFLLVYIIIFLIFKKVLYNYLNQYKRSHVNMNSYLVESLTGFETIKGLGIEKNIVEKLKDLLHVHLQKQKQLEEFSNIEQVITSFLNGMMMIILIFVGISLVNQKLLSFSSFVTFLFLFHYFIEPVKNILNLVRNMEDATISYKRISEIMNDECKSIPNEQIDISSIKIGHSNCYQNQSFLNNQTLKIGSKEKIVLLGPSGSGKSTLLKMLKKYYETNNVIMNQKNIRDISQEDINRNIIYISQNEILFTDTLYNNLVLNEEIDQKKLHQVIKDCCIEEIIQNHSLNYYMLIEENGFNISGGEKQRIILARALLRKFNYLLIDEGLSQVDISLERKILKNILKNYSNKSIVFVTHRKHNIDLFDRVIEMRDGKIIEDLTRNTRKEVL